jgi:hypothetical protein
VPGHRLTSWSASADYRSMSGAQSQATRVRKERKEGRSRIIVHPSQMSRRQRKVKRVSQVCAEHL